MYGVKILLREEKDASQTAVLAPNARAAEYTLKRRGKASRLSYIIGIMKFKLAFALFPLHFSKRNDFRTQHSLTNCIVALSMLINSDASKNVVDVGVKALRDSITCM